MNVIWSVKVTIYADVVDAMANSARERVWFTQVVI